MERGGGGRGGGPQVCGLSPSQTRKNSRCLGRACTRQLQVALSTIRGPPNVGPGGVGSDLGRGAGVRYQDSMCPRTDQPGTPEQACWHVLLH